MTKDSSLACQRGFNARRMLLSVVCVVMIAAPSYLCAQATGKHETHDVSLALTYAAAHAYHVNTTDFWLGGGGLDVRARLFRGLGFAASATGLHHGSANAVATGLDLVMLTFGPTYTVRAGRRVSVFGEGLVGEANGFHSVFSYGSGPTSNPANGSTDSANSVAVQAGGGVDIRVTPRLSVRALQADYLRTEFPNANENVQNNLRVAAGVVVRFGK